MAVKCKHVVLGPIVEKKILDKSGSRTKDALACFSVNFALETRKFLISQKLTSFKFLCVHITLPQVNPPFQVSSYKDFSFQVYIFFSRLLIYTTIALVLRIVVLLHWLCIDFYRSKLGDYKHN